MRLLPVFTITLFIVACASSGDSHVVKYEAPGNLQSTNPVACVTLSEVTSNHTPADTFPGVRKCIDAKAFDRAVDLFAIAGAYGRFDMLRVNDVSAHQAISALQAEYLGAIDQSSTEAFQSMLDTRLMEGSPALANLCTRVKAIGPPTYRPEYMLQHGMSAFTGSGGGMKADFDSVAAWQKTLTGYLTCPAEL